MALILGTLAGTFFIRDAGDMYVARAKVQQAAAAKAEILDKQEKAKQLRAEKDTCAATLTEKNIEYEKLMKDRQYQDASEVFLKCAESLNSIELRDKVLAAKAGPAVEIIENPLSPLSEKRTALDNLREKEPGVAAKYEDKMFKLIAKESARIARETPQTVSASPIASPEETLSELRAVIEGRESPKQFLFCASLADHWQEKAKYVLQGKENWLIGNVQRALPLLANSVKAGRLFKTAAQTSIGKDYGTQRMLAMPELWTVLNKLEKGEGEAWVMWRSCELGMTGLILHGTVSQASVDAAEAAALTVIELAKNGVYH